MYGFDFYNIKYRLHNKLKKHCEIEKLRIHKL